MAESLVEDLRKQLLVPLSKRYLGPVRHIYCYVPLEGGIPAREFLDALPAEAAASYGKSFEKHALGLQLRGEKHHPLTDTAGLAEYKDIQSKSRLIHMTDIGMTWILLYGFTGKKEDRIAPVHVQRATRLRDEYVERRRAIAAAWDRAPKHPDRR